MLASIVKTPELALTEIEAKTLAKATADVAQFYPATFNPEIMAWFNLASCVGVCYGPRIYMIRKRKEAERKAKNSNPEKVDNQPVNNMGYPGMTGSLGPVADAVNM